MAKKKSNNKKKANTSSNNDSNNNAGTGDGMMVDPARVRFQHARIRPLFSGCGRGVEDTLEEIRQGKLRPSDLPPIQVLLGPIEAKTGQPWYFSLNNRRLYVLKRCREEGLLEPQNNQIYVRVRKPKSEQEACRYTVENCALEAKIMPEKSKPSRGSGGAKKDTKDTTDASSGLVETDNDVEEDLIQTTDKHLSITPADASEVEQEDGDDSDSSYEEPTRGTANRFSALF